MTSTLTVLETVTPGRPVPPGLDVLDPILRDQFLQRKAAVDRNAASTVASLYPKLAKLDVAFFRAGGLLLTGDRSDRHRRCDCRLLEPACARAAGRGRPGDVVGSIVAGKQADLRVIDGDPSARIDDVRKGTLVFKQGVGYDRRSLLPRFGVASDCSDVDAITR